MNVMIGFEVFVGHSSEAWAMVSGRINLPSLPKVGDYLVLIPPTPELVRAGFPTALRVEHILDRPENRPDLHDLADKKVMLKDVFLETFDAAESLGAALQVAIGASIDRW
jgi:hypothetical protein